MEEKKIVDTNFFKAFRKRGFGLTIDILNSVTDKGMKESAFFDALKKRGSYLNEFYRVKKSLISFGFVAYQLDEVYDKVIFITPKGMDLASKIEEIEKLFETPIIVKESKKKKN